jgi:CubicO group peptidase (beta-lactamase class C family)
MSSPRLQPVLFEMMEKAVSDGVFPGGTLQVRQGGRTVHSSAHGVGCLPPGDTRRVRLNTCFDLASLTKVLSAGAMALLLIQRGKLRLRDRVCDHVGAFTGQRREKVTILHLLNHTSGLAAWRPYFHEVAASGGASLLGTGRGRDAIRAMVAAESPEAQPGRRQLYSDLNFILLDWILERVAHRPADAFFSGRIAPHLKRGHLFFVDIKSRRKALRARKNRLFAATERCAWRGRILSGEVHDDNAFAMGGVCGHAGLFGDVNGVAQAGTLWLDSYLGRANLFDRDLTRRFFRARPGSRALGFDTPSKTGSSAGRHFGPRSVGHTGFTGTSLWMDPDRELVVVLLTNRIHPSRSNQAIAKFRPVLHDRVAEVIRRTGR